MYEIEKAELEKRQEEILIEQEAGSHNYIELENIQQRLCTIAERIKEVNDSDLIIRGRTVTFNEFIPIA